MLADDSLPNNLTSGPLNRLQEVATKKFTIQLNDLTTELMAQKFKNRIVVNITQCQSFGSIINITKDDEGYFSTSNSEVALSLNFLLGLQTPVYKILATKIGVVIFKATNMPILLTLALKDRKPDAFKAIMENLKEIDVWSMF
jgi:Uncharacterised conserved protein (DUF2372).